MIQNKEKYEQAVHYRKRGFTYSEIAKICEVSKSTVSNWLAQQSFSKAIKRTNVATAARDNKKRLALMQKVKQAERNKNYQVAERNAATEYKHYKKDQLFIAGVQLYMGVGDVGDDHKIRVTSNRFENHAVFIQFAIMYMGVAKQDIQFWLLLSGKTALEPTMKWWAKQLKIPLGRFGKTQFVNSQSKALHKGTGNTIIGNTVLKKKLMVWVALLKEELLK